MSRSPTVEGIVNAASRKPFNFMRFVKPLSRFAYHRRCALWHRLHRIDRCQARTAPVPAQTDGEGFREISMRMQKGLVTSLRTPLVNVQGWKVGRVSCRLGRYCNSIFLDDVVSICTFQHSETDYLLLEVGCRDVRAMKAEKYSLCERGSHLPFLSIQHIHPLHQPKVRGTIIVMTSLRRW
jgi:hypothetical protein